MASTTKSSTPSDYDDDDVMIIDDSSDENSNLDDASTSSNIKLAVETDETIYNCRNRHHELWGSQEEDGNFKWPSQLQPKVQYVFKLIGFDRIPGAKRKYCHDCVKKAIELNEDEVSELEKKANIRLPRKFCENAQIQQQLEKLNKMNISDEEKALQTKQLRMLAFVNPGKFMDDFDPERSTREMKKMNRRILKEKNAKKSQMYTDEGLLVSNNADLCDCLEVDCPGCHFPCPKCGSAKCGDVCRGNRRWVYEHIDIEGTGKTMSWPS